MDPNYKKKLKKFTYNFCTKLNTGNKIEGDQKIKGATAPPYCYNYCIIETLRWQSTLKAIFVPSIRFSLNFQNKIFDIYEWK